MKLKLGRHEGPYYMDKDTRKGVFVSRVHKDYFYVSKIFKVKDESTIRLERRRVSSTEKDTKSVRNSVNLPMELLSQLIDVLREFHAEETGQPRGKDLEDKKLSEDIKKLGLQ